ncbi:hypothetical protein F2Q70_00043277 [Brassica cretica]|uniref:Uncharacterized protein n=1 Tax=Brassica cretica TaxID=69181 RepID=A0A8S9KKW6_BRACR|nr:hypothetical protein F2Q70_00043277 [Brassica cretica]
MFVTFNPQRETHIIDRHQLYLVDRYLLASNDRHFSTKINRYQPASRQGCDSYDVDNDKGDEEDVNFISGIGFQNQRSGNQSGNINFHSNGQRGNYNQSSQYQKSYCNNYNNNNTTFGSSSYQNPPLETQESKIEGA